MTDYERGQEMAYVVKRASGFAGYYRDSQKQRRSAGVFSSKREALAAAAAAEAGIEIPRAVDQPERALTLTQHSRQWFDRPDPEVLPNTLRGYRSAFKAHILPVLGDKQVTTITRRDVELLIWKARQEGASEHQAAQIKAALGACLRSLVPDVMLYNPTHGVKIPIPPAKAFDLLQKDEIEALVEAMPSRGAALFTRFLAGTGARFGEAAEVRVRDLNLRSNEIRIARRVTDLIKKSSDGQRFKVIPGTKAGVIRASPIFLGVIKAVEQFKMACGTGTARNHRCGKGQNLGPADGGGEL